jgi:hypothetical protein
VDNLEVNPVVAIVFGVPVLLHQPQQLQHLLLSVTITAGVMQMKIRLIALAIATQPFP